MHLLQPTRVRHRRIPKGPIHHRPVESGQRNSFPPISGQKIHRYFQSFSNTYAPVEKLKSLYEEALAVDDVVGLSIGTRPDCVNEDVLNLLQSYAKNHLIWIEYGLQSAHDATLARINRGHDVSLFAMPWK